MPDSPAIEITGLSKHYGDLVALDDLNLTVERGEVFGFLGPNGAGKTTTVKLILGLVRPSAGEVRIFGRSMAAHRKELLQEIGAMVEAPAFYPFLSGRENLVYLAKLARMPESAVDETLARVGLERAAGRLFETYSMGMKQRLALAAALLRRPKLVLLDEPTSGLDPAGQREIRALIPELARSGCTVFFSSHMMHEVQEVCGRIGILREGRLLRTAGIAELTATHNSVEITIDAPELALEILRGIDWVVDARLAGDKLLVEAPAGRSAELNRALAERGLYAAGIRPRERTVEEAFFESLEAQAA